MCVKYVFERCWMFHILVRFMELVQSLWVVVWSIEDPDLCFKRRMMSVCHVYQSFGNSVTEGASFMRSCICPHVMLRLGLQLTIIFIISSFVDCILFSVLKYQKVVNKDSVCIDIKQRKAASDHI